MVEICLSKLFVKTKEIILFDSVCCCNGKFSVIFYEPLKKQTHAAGMLHNLFLFLSMSAIKNEFVLLLCKRSGEEIISTPPHRNGKHTLAHSKIAANIVTGAVRIALCCTKLPSCERTPNGIRQNDFYDMRRLQTRINRNHRRSKDCTCYQNNRKQ